jgi:hypothetical protein
MAGWAVGEGGCASEDQLLGLRVADDDGIIVATADSCISIVRYMIHLCLEEVEAIQALRIARTLSGGQEIETYSTISFPSREE